MAGEWIAVDLALPDKPEFQEIIDLTGKDRFEVQFWLIRLWGWASMHCADGTARMTVLRLVRTVGADEAFWRSVAAVGWLELDEVAATVAVPGWDRRFSQAAKARLQHRDRAAAQEGERGRLRSGAGAPCAQAQAPPALERRRGEESRVPPPPREAALPEQVADGWQQLVTAWNTGATPASRRKPWKPVQAPDGGLEAVGTPGWLEGALEAIQRLPVCRYFESPVPLSQFVREGFVAKVLGGQYDAPKNEKAAQTLRGQDGRPSAAEASEAWKRAAADPEAARMREEFLAAKRRKAGQDGGQQPDEDFDTGAAKAAAIKALEAVK